MEKMKQTAQEIIDEVNSRDEKELSLSGGKVTRAFRPQTVPDTNSLFTIPQEELSKISWEELKE